MTITVTQLDIADQAACRAWDRFVLNHPAGTVFHRTAWPRSIAQAMGHRPYLFCIERNGAIAAVLPVIHVRHALFGNRLVSCAFGVYGGPLADSADDHQALDEAAWALALKVGAQSLEYRDRARLRPDWPARTDVYASFRMPIAADEEACLKALPGKRRNMIRKAIKSGLDYEVDQHVDRQYAIYAESVRNLGTPVFPKALMARLKDNFGDDCVIQIIRHDGHAVAAALSLIFRNEIHIYYAGGTPAARAVAANDFMFWAVMQYGRANGLTLFDLGRSKEGTGAWTFKTLWGLTPEPLAYEFRLAPGQALPNLNPTSGKYARAVALWQKLPLPVANLLGPLLSRGLG